MYSLALFPPSPPEGSLLQTERRIELVALYSAFTFTSEEVPFLTAQCPSDIQFSKIVLLVCYYLEALQLPGNVTQRTTTDE